jgi:hypothetical protein
MVFGGAPGHLPFRLGYGAMRDILLGACIDLSCCMYRLVARVFPDAGEEAKYAFCMIGNLDDIARTNRLCNDLGLDTMDVGVVMAVAMEVGL